VAVKEWNDEIIFLRKLVEGSTNRSYGIQVARLAGIPEKVVKRAKEILRNIEAGEFDGVGIPKVGRSKEERGETSGLQLPLFQTTSHAVIHRLKELELDTMTPIEALNQLHALKKLL
jgi:DNA mismatch repair protein MutS